MWIVLKYKKKEFDFLKKDLRKSLGNLPQIVCPKFKYKKLVKNKLLLLEKNILDDYLICYHEKFQNVNTLTTLKNLRGLKYFLINSKINQREIINFINF